MGGGMWKVVESIRKVGGGSKKAGRWMEMVGALQKVCKGTWRWVNSLSATLE